MLFSLVTLCFLAGISCAAERARVTLPQTRPLTAACVLDAARAGGLPAAALFGILATEGGKTGEALRNTNGTWDMGPFQINTVHVDTLAAMGIAQGADIFLWLRSLMVSAVVGFIIFMIDSLVQMDHMKRMIRTNLINFLENVLPNRVNKSMKKKDQDRQLQKKQKARVQKEKEEAEEIAGHWEQIASAKELTLTQEDIQTLKDFINEL